jgi:hypothetical protein
MRERRSAGIKYRATPAHAAKLKAYAAERGRSVSATVADLLIEHMRDKLAAEQNPERAASIQKAIDSMIGPLKRRPPRAPVVRYHAPEQPGGYVYFLKCGQFYKIGRSKSLKQRFMGFPFPEKPRLIKVVRCLDYGILEKALHALFAHKRTHGEWFDLSEDEVLQAKRYMADRE